VLKKEKKEAKLKVRNKVSIAEEKSQVET